MAKNNDPFEKFRSATLGGEAPLSDAIKGSPSDQKKDGPAVGAPSPVSVKRSKNENRKLVSFHIDNDTYLKLGRLKFDMGVKYDDLYNEALRDLLAKYGVL